MQRHSDRVRASQANEARRRFARSGRRLLALAVGFPLLAGLFVLTNPKQSGDTDPLIPVEACALFVVAPAGLYLLVACIRDLAHWLSLRRER